MNDRPASPFRRLRRSSGDPSARLAAPARPRSRQRCVRPFTRCAGGSCGAMRHLCEQPPGEGRGAARPWGFRCAPRPDSGSHGSICSAAVAAWLWVVAPGGTLAVVDPDRGQPSVSRSTSAASPFELVTFHRLVTASEATAAGVTQGRADIAICQRALRCNWELNRLPVGGEALAA
jgi:hypothetical protein